MSRDPIVQQVIDKLKERSDAGYKKYGVTLQNDDQPLHVWLNHLQEELLDAANYIQKLKSLTSEMMEDKMIKDFEVIDPHHISAYPEPDFGDMWTTNTTWEKR